MTSTKTDEKKLSRFFKDLEEFDDDDGSGEEENEDIPDDIQNEEENQEELGLSQSLLKSPAISRKETSSETESTEEGSEKQKQRLPSAHECLKSQSNPEFLRILNKKDVDWDKFHKPLPSEEGDAASRVEFESSAVPPPTSYEPVTDPGIKVVDSEGRKRKTINDDLEDQMSSTKAYKVHPPEDEDQ